jgi:GMP synthase (glutamine-hydrolysing)
MNKRVVLIRHGDEPADDRVVSFFRSRGLEPELRYPYRGDHLGNPDESVAASVIYGGPFNVFETDRHPFLLDEHRWAERCMAREIPLLGICQGAQSIAQVLGATVGPKPGEPHEFGYYPIFPTAAGRVFLPDRLHVAQSHFHEFGLPAGAELLAYSEAFPHQAMRYGARTYAFQFHAEVTRAGFRRWQAAPWAAFGKPGAQIRAEQDRLGAAHDARQHAWFMSFLEGLFADAGSWATRAHRDPGERSAGAPCGNRTGCCRCW